MKSLFTGVPFRQYLLSGFQQKITRHTKRKKKNQFENTDQASEPDWKMTRMLELSDHEFETTMINMLRGSNWKSKQCARNNGQGKERGENPKQESKTKKKPDRAERIFK